MAFWHSSKDQASSQPDGGAPDFLTPERVQEILLDEGYKAKLEKGEDGLHTIRTGAEGLSMTLLLYPDGESGAKVSSLQFHAGIAVEETNEVKLLLAANAFNLQYRLAKAIVDRDGGFRLEFDALCHPGFQRDAFLRNWGGWLTMVGAFVSHLRDSQLG